MDDDAPLREEIFTLIQQHEINEQADLQRLLKEKGYEIPQATISRKLKKFRVAKVAGVYRKVDQLPHDLPRILQLRYSEFGTIVLHTAPGYANGLASFIDQRYLVQSPKDGGAILGTIAGDDTVLVIVKNKEAMMKVLAAFRRDFPSIAPFEGE